MNSNHTIYKGKRLVLSAGTWSKELLAKLGLNLPATLIRKAFAWFKVDGKFTRCFSKGWTFNTLGLICFESKNTLHTKSRESGNGLKRKSNNSFSCRSL